MKPPREKQAIPVIAEALSELFGRPLSEIKLRSSTHDVGYEVEVGGYQFLAEYKRVSSAGPLKAGIANLSDGVIRGKRQYPLLVVPYMGPLGSKLCDEANIPWLDLSGNANINIPGQRIWIEGRPNKFRNPGRPPNLFAPKSSRVARQLLVSPSEFLSQSQIARRTGLGDGYVSKIVRRLEAESYLDVHEDGRVRPRSPDLLLEAWRDAYDFESHRIVKGHVAARSGIELLERLASLLAPEQVGWAATGLGAAWYYTGYTMFRLTSLYLAVEPSRALLQKIGFTAEEKGANLWLIVPNDDGVFCGSTEVDGVRLVSPIQTYLDLKQHPERAEDAAIRLREDRLQWRAHAS
jgi:hypothetical protein